MATATVTETQPPTAATSEVPSSTTAVPEPTVSDSSADEEDSIAAEERQIKASAKDDATTAGIQMYCFTISMQRLRLIKTLAIFALLLFMLLFACYTLQIGPFS